MKLLVLGGTKFLGRAVAEAALARDHELTLFNRGRTNPDLFPAAEHLHGDRDGDLGAPDVRDLGEWLVRGAEERARGVFNAVGPAEPLTMGVLLETIRAGTGGDARLRWVAGEFLSAHGVEEWSTLPLWFVDPAYRGMQRADNSKGLAAGLRLRPLEETVRDTLAWIRSGEATFTGEARPGLEPAREAALLAEAA